MITPVLRGVVHHGVGIIRRCGLPKRIESFGVATPGVTVTAAAVEAAKSYEKIWSSSEEAAAGGGRCEGMGDVIVTDQDVVDDYGEGRKLGGITFGEDLMGDLRKR